MAGLGRKVFTAGDVLTASDVQNYMMDQSVMYFAGTAARSSAIATPTTGMTSYIGVTGTATIPQLETYTGSAWQTPYGLTEVATATVSAGASAVQIDNVFNTTYENYLVTISNLRLSGAAGFLMRLNNSSVNSNYNFNRTYATYGGSTVAADTAASGAFFHTGIVADSGNPSGGNFCLYAPFTAAATTYSGIGVDGRSGGGSGPVSGMHNVATSYTGIYLYPSAGTISSGTVRVYGLRNS